MDKQISVYEQLGTARGIAGCQADNVKILLRIIDRNVDIKSLNIMDLIDLEIVRNSTKRLDEDLEESRHGNDRGA